MNSLTHTVLAIAAMTALAASATAQSMTKAEYNSQRETIEAGYRKDKATCNPLAGFASRSCMVKAKGIEKTGKADLEMNYKPNTRTHYAASMAHAEAAYDNAREACNDQNGNVKNVCIKEARAVNTAAVADAKLQRTSLKAKTAIGAGVDKEVKK